MGLKKSDDILEENSLSNIFLDCIFGKSKRKLWLYLNINGELEGKRTFFIITVRNEKYFKANFESHPVKI